MNRDERIAKGVAFLDSHVGEKWVNRIDLDELDLGLTHRCVLGQGMGWDQGIEILYQEIRDQGTELEDDDMVWEAQYGFEFNMGADERYSNLTKAWKRTIKKLKKERE